MSLTHTLVEGVGENLVLTMSLTHTVGRCR